MRRSLLPPDTVPDLLDIVATLDDAAERTGDRCYVRARNALVASTGGRPKLDDARLIEEVIWHVESGAVGSLNQALHLVAETANNARSPRSVAERLRRKIAAAAKKATGSSTK